MLVYAAFDPFPAPKGAATHIAAFARALGAAHGPLTLLTVEPRAALGDAADSPQVGPDLGAGVTHVPLPAPGRTLIDRVLAFRAALLRWWPTSPGSRRVEVAHVRSIYEGYPLARAKGALCARLVYEVNGLPSIELKYHYPDAADDRELLTKLRAQERRCLEAADLVVTPSPVTGAHLLAQGLPPARLRVIPNGVDPAGFPFAPPRDDWTAAGGAARPARLLYAGTLTAWQGVHVALEALALYRRDHPATLTLVGPARKRRREALLERAADLGVGGHVDVRPPVSQEALAALHHEHDVALAPLLPNDRNLVQGCCPLKVLEAMAAGTPLVASDMPCVTALARRDEHALLVRPGSAKAVKDALLRLRAEPGLGARLARAARARAEADLTWERSTAALLAAYEEVLGLGRTS